jgi:signal transduction histidine kinase
MGAMKGLGLYLARQVVLAHAGTIRVRSDGEATVFTVVLPRGDVKPPA